MSIDVRETALLVDRVAAGVPGVTRVFPADASVTRVARQALGSAAPLSVVRATGGAGSVGATVEVSVGVEGDPASIGDEVSRAVRAAVAAAVVGAAGSIVVRVRISRVR